MTPLVILILSLLWVSILIAPPARAEQDSTILGVWELIPAKSTNIDWFGTVTVDIRESGKNLTLIQVWGTRQSYRDSVVLTLGGSSVGVPISNWVFPGNVFMGLMKPAGEKRRLAATWERWRTALRIDEQSSRRISRKHT